jgi:hypothetical protein
MLGLCRQSCFTGLPDRNRRLLARFFRPQFFGQSPVAPAAPPPAPGSVYTYRASLIGSARHYELTQEGLLWRIGRRSGVWPYRDISGIRLSFRPTGMQNRRFRADITNRNGGRIAILSTSKQTVALMEPQAGYRGFIMQLHRRLAEAGSDATLGAGLRPGTYRLLVSAVVFFGIAMAVLLVRALATGEFAGVIFILGFAALFARQIGGFIRRNRSRNYTFDAVPQNLLP